MDDMLYQPMPSIHAKIWRIALPLTLANLAIPLVGMVDAGVMGHQDDPKFLAAVAVGSTIISCLFFVFGFLRMGICGLAAQAYGRGDALALRTAVYQSLLLGSLLCVVALAICPWLIPYAVQWVGATAEVSSLASDYVQWRLAALPFVILQLVSLGCLIGLQHSRAPLWILLASSSINIVLDLLLVVVFPLHIHGVAIASLIADSCGGLLALVLCWRALGQHPAHVAWSQIKSGRALRQLLSLNRDIFIRTLLLLSTFAYFTHLGAQQGATTLAANMLLMNLLLLLAYILDGQAYAVEALAGSALGRGEAREFWSVFHATLGWTLVMTAIISLIYAVMGPYWIGWLTDLESVRLLALAHLGWMVALPWCAAASFFFDGVFIAAALGRAMRNTMLVSVGCFMLLALWAPLHWANHGVWLAMLGFMLARSTTQAWVWYHYKPWRGYLTLSKSGT